MNAETFQKMLKEVFDKVEGVLGQKATEYATSDRLHNFKKAAALQGISPREAVAGMMAKHTVSVYDLIMNGTYPTLAMWDEKILDHINYLILLRAIVVEELDETEC